MRFFSFFFFFFFNDTATTEIYTLSLHDALPIWPLLRPFFMAGPPREGGGHSFPRSKACKSRARGLLFPASLRRRPDRKSTRLNSSHLVISYAVFCLKKKKKTKTYCLN